MNFNEKIKIKLQRLIAMKIKFMPQCQLDFNQVSGSTMSILPIVLASSSPARTQQLKQLNIPFSIDPPQIDESAQLNETAAKLVLRLAAEKTQAIAMRHSNKLIIGGDQVELIGKTILGKPHHIENARKQLSLCSGKITHFFTGLALLNTHTQRLQTKLVITRVYFKTLSTQEIEAYIQRDQPLHCAGSIKIESQGLLLIDQIYSNDPFAILGIPLTALNQMFQAEGINLLTDFT
jgi:MAF protein